MYVHFVKDFENHGKIIGVVVAVATNKVGYAIAHPNGIIDKEAKADLVAFAIHRAMKKDFMDSAKDLENSIKEITETPSDVSYNKRRILMIKAFSNMYYKAGKFKSLPTMVYPVKE